MLSSTFFDIAAPSFAFICVALIYLSSKLRSNSPLPPGPQPLPIVGNLLQMPKQDPYIQYMEWAKIYGSIVHFHIFGRSFIILNDFQTAVDLFEKRSSVYSTKPHLVMAGELVGREKTSILFTKYGPKLKECRKIVHSWINKSTISDFLPVQEAGSFKLLGSLLSNPDAFSEHIRSCTGSVILELTYGIKCLPDNDPHIAMSEQLSRITAKATQPGRWLCDSFPWMAYIPEWLPGASFKQWAKQSKVVATGLVRMPFEDVIKSYHDGTYAKSWALNSLLSSQGILETGYAADNVMIAAGTMYAGGIDTTVSALRTFFLMMARHPEVQEKAQAEIDFVIGPDRLPKFEDRIQLPYLDQVIKEVLRFNPVVPLVPHSLDQDDIYLGYKIPKGAWVMVNNWAILHDPEIYQNPDHFNPDRFSGEGSERDPTNIAFGWGRRACPGYHFAMTSVFLNMAHVLSTFTISAPANPDGDLCLPPLDFITGHLRAPADFKCVITPRTQKKIALIQQVIAGL